jgi:hypothetical protein
MTSLTITVLLTLLCVRVNAVPVEKFYPFGLNHGDTALPKNVRDTVSAEISLRVPVNFYGTSYSSLYVSIDGRRV